MKPENKKISLVEYWFDPKQCGIYSSRYRFCFRTNAGNTFITDLDICLQSYPYWKAMFFHRKRQIHEAFRLAILNQIETAKEKHFRLEKVRVCEISGDLFTKETCHADHGGPRRPRDLSCREPCPKTFSQILQGFLKEEKRVYDIQMKDIELTSEAPYELANTYLKQRWQNFHAEFAVLHIVSRRANLYLCH